MTLYRNGHDATKMLVLIEYANEAAQEAAREEEGTWQASLTHCLDPASINEHVWEIMTHTDHAAERAVDDLIEGEGKQNKS